MCGSCLLDMYDLAAAMRGGRGYAYRGDFFGGGDGIDRYGFAPVSQRAMGALERAKTIFLNHLATVDTSKGPVTAEIIDFHLVTDMRKEFNKFVRGYECVPLPRQLTRAEQDKINKTRKSLLWYTAVKVTPAAQQAYFVLNPHLAAKHAHASASAGSSGSGSGSASSSAASTSTSTSTSTASSMSSAPSAKTPLQDVTTEKVKRTMNEAAVERAKGSGTVKKMRNSKMGA